MEKFKCSECGKEIPVIRAFTSILGETKKCNRCSSPVGIVWRRKVTSIVFVLSLSVIVFFFQNDEINFLTFASVSFVLVAAFLYYLKANKNPFETHLSRPRRILLFSLGSFILLVFQAGWKYEMYAAVIACIIAIPIYLKLK